MSTVTAQPITGPAAWHGSDLAKSADWIFWLSMPNSQALPPGFEVLWGRIEPGALRGGITQS